MADDHCHILEEQVVRIPPQSFDFIANFVGPSDVIVGDGLEMTLLTHCRVLRERAA